MAFSRLYSDVSLEGLPPFCNNTTGLYNPKNDLHLHHSYNDRKINRTIAGLIKIAIEEAYKSPYSHKHGAILYSGRKGILSVGYNHCATKARGSTIWGTHAEMDCFNKFWKKEKKGLVKKKDLKNACLIVVRVNGTGIAYSAPCQSCRKKFLKYAREYGCSCLYYT